MPKVKLHEDDLSFILTALVVLVGCMSPYLPMLRDECPGPCRDPESLIHVLHEMIELRASEPGN